jgi:hypothetical protein
MNGDEGRSEITAEDNGVAPFPNVPYDSDDDGGANLGGEVFWEVEAWSRSRS